MTLLRPTSFKYHLLVFIILFVVLTGYRISTNIENTVIIDHTSIGNIPWSDAGGWVGGSESIQQGEIMSDFPSRRPIYPAFLALLFSSTGGTYFAAIIGQIILFSSATIFCFYLLNGIQEKYAVAFFLSCIAIWLPITQSLFLTENLGSISLVISFGFLWRGLRNSCTISFAVGLFILSFSFSVRPWAIGYLITLPLFAFIGIKSLKEKIKRFSFFMFFIFLGILVNFLVTYLFANPETASNYSQTLYGLVTNTLSWRAASLDPVISQYMQQDISSLELNKIIIQRSISIFVDNPLLFLNSALTTYYFYFKYITNAFNEKIYLYPLFFLFFLILLSATHKKISKIQIIILISCIALVFLKLEKYIFIFTILYGFYVTLSRLNSNIGKFAILYFIGILISLPLVGIDGGDRVKISSDIFLFFLCSLGVQNFISKYEDTVSGFSWRKENIYMLSIIPFLFLILTLFPWLLRFYAVDEEIIIKELSSQEIAKQLELSSLPLSASEVHNIGKKWPEPSYETLHGEKFYSLIKYTDRDTLFLFEDQNVSIRPHEFWPLQNFFNPPIARSIHIRSWSIFPNSSREDLKKFDKKYIYVVGTILGLPRTWKNDTGYTVLVENIGRLEKNGEVTWNKINSLD